MKSQSEPFLGYLKRGTIRTRVTIHDFVNGN